MRRTAGRTATALMAEAGFKLRELGQRVGPAVGTATHAGVAHSMQARIDTGEKANATETEQVAIEALDRSVSFGVEFDNTSPNLNTAQKQVVRQYRSYRLHLEDTIIPRTVERRIEKLTKRGNILSGQPDQTDDGVRDLKTGVAKRVNGLQYGAYALLLGAEEEQVSHITEDYVKRVAIDKEQPVPEQIPYDPVFWVRAAGAVIMDVEQRFEEFQADGDQMVFVANPNSMLCSDRWCLAFKTDFCPESFAK